MKNKVLIIGIDSLDPGIVDKLIKKLPNLKSLETFTKLETTIPPETPVAWSAASTGSNPGRYGIYDFINRDPRTYLPRLNLAIEKPGLVKTEYICAMKGIPFWRILNENKIKTTIIRWPVTFPAEKVDGRMLSGLGVVDIKGMLNSYSFYTNKEIDENAEGKEKIVHVNIKNNSIETYISGPFTRKHGEMKDIRVPMKITIKSNEIIINIDGKEYRLKPKQWSEMIRVKFKMGFLMEVCGILKFYLLSLKPKFRMYMTSIQIDPENQVVGITHPKEYGEELVKKIGLFQTLGMPEDTKAVTENRLDESIFLEQIKQIEEERNKMFFYEFERFNEGVYTFVFDAGDRLKHIFWNNKTISKEIEDYYIGKDRLVGDVISKLDDNTKLIIFSDHGFSNFDRQVNINSWLVSEGYMKDKETGGKLFGFVDWNKTKAYSLGFTSVYLNLKARESNGIVDDRDELTKEIIDKLKKLKDNKKNVFTNVYDGRKVYKGKYAHLAPDIVVGFSPGYRMSWKSAIGALDKEIISDNEGKWKGDHLIDRSHVPGVLFTNFKINKKNPNIMDVAPTVLKLFNVTPPESMDGEALN
jgi:predicted AlkP superfamily phosphohydrolase/phosphomutase